MHNAGTAPLVREPTAQAEELRQFYSRYDEGEPWRKREDYFNLGIRDVGRLLFRWGPLVVYYLTSRRVLVGHSTLVLAQRESD